MPIVPDTKNWTWVLERPCPECGFDAKSVTTGELPERFRANAATWHEILATREEGDLRRRPSDDRWSALEYACHVRDVFALFDYRLGLMVNEDDPTFANWDQDATAVADHYNEQDPSAVAPRLLEAGGILADSFGAVDGEAWQRTGTRSDGARFTIESFGRYLLHDPVHHLWDVGWDVGQPVVP